MKNLVFIAIASALLGASCATGGFSGGEYDDLYYSKSDRVEKQSKKAVAESRTSSQPDQYFDNIYAADTLVADGYNDIVEFENPDENRDNKSGAFEYLDDPWSYSNRLNMFYGNSFYPYWRDPFYYYPRYYYDYYSPYYGYGGMYPYYGGMYPYSYYPYGGYYGGFYGGINIGFGYGPFSFNMGYGGYYPTGVYYPSYVINENGENQASQVGRRARYSSLTQSTRADAPGSKSGVTVSESAGRRSGSVTSQSTASTDYRRSNSTTGTSLQNSTQENRSMTSTNALRRDSNAPTRDLSRPEYGNANRNYTPSYSNPRMSERPAYNNSRTSQGNVQQSYPGSNRSSTQGLYRNPSETQLSGRDRTGSSFSTNQVRSGSSGNVNTYSVPSRRSYDSGSSLSGGSRSSFSNDYSGSSSRSSGSSSFSGGSSSSGSSSFSGGGGGGGREASVASGTRR